MISLLRRAGDEITSLVEIIHSRECRKGYFHLHSRCIYPRHALCGSVDLQAFCNRNLVILRREINGEISWRINWNSFQRGDSKNFYHYFT